MGKYPKRKEARKKLILNRDFQPLKHVKKKVTDASEYDDWSSSQWPDVSWTQAAGWKSARADAAWVAATPLNLANYPTHVVLDFRCTRSIGSRLAIERFKKHPRYHGITTKFCTCNKNFCVHKFRNLLGKWHCSLSNNINMFNSC